MLRSCSALLLLVACSHPGAVRADAAAGGDGGGARDAALADGPPEASSQVRVIVEPNGNDGAELIDAIAGAQHSVYMTMYQLDNTDLIDALTARASAGVDVQVVLDGSSTSKSWNTPAYDQLQAAGASTVWSSSAFTYTHEKTVIVDGTQAWIMTMNGNRSSPYANREYLAIDTSPADLAEATAIFMADHAHQAITPTGTLVVANSNAREKLVQLIDSATTNLDAELEELSDLYSTGVVNALSRAAARGVAVRIVLANDASPSGSQAQAIAQIQGAGGTIVVTGPTSGHGTSSDPYIHAKALVVDCTAGTCARGFVGSENFSGGSLGYNRELGVIFTEPAELAKVEAAIAGDFARGTAP